METGYQDPQNAQNYINFLDSTNGQIQRQILSAAIFSALPSSANITILDAACGSGWLTNKLSAKYPHTEGCDSSPTLLTYAHQHLPQIKFQEADVTAKLPYDDNYFDVVILNMAAPDISDLHSAMENLSAKIKPGGKLIMTVPHPSYTYPAAVWKRSLLDVLLGRKPKLKTQKLPAGTKSIIREFGGQFIASHYHTLSDYQNAAAGAGLHQEKLIELKSQTDSSQFDLNYQMYRYPLILLMEFRK